MFSKNLYCRNLQFFGALGVGFYLVALAGIAAAEPQPMTTDEMIELARPAVGHAYHWDHGNWTLDGTDIGKCTLNTSSSGCGACSFQGKVGADCSGFVAKVWQIPDPTPVEVDVHPYYTGLFSRSTGGPWTMLPVDRSDVRRGDAFVANVDGVRKHIVLVDQVDDDGSGYVLYQASGCKKGITHSTSNPDANFKPLRRDLRTEKSCDKNRDCNGRGECHNDGTCHCDGNFMGDSCERCKPGFSGAACDPVACSIPGEDAEQPDGTPLLGELTCGAKRTFKLEGGANHHSAYDCGPSPLNAQEMSFSFRPPGVGTASISVTSAADVSMMLMKHDCDPTNCFMSDKSELSFSFGGSDTFFVTFDAPAVTTETVRVEVDCDVPRNTFIGDPCTSDDECPSTIDRVGNGTMTREGVCYNGPQGRFCTMECTRSCPDASNAAPVGCVDDPLGNMSKMCVPEPSPFNLECSAVPGTQVQNVKRHFDGTKRDYCVPVEDLTACQGTFHGLVSDATDGTPIAGAQASYLAVMGNETVVTGADGTFTTALVPCGKQTITTQATNYSPNHREVEVASATTDAGRILLQSHANQCVPQTTAVKGQVLHGVLGYPIEGAVVEIRPGFDISTGDAEDTLTTGADGAFSFGGLVGGDYTISATADGYVSGTRDTVTVCDSSEIARDLHLVPVAAEEEAYALRFVLSWTQPKDLDLHLLLPDGNDVFFYGECRGSADSFPHATLDVDHYQADGPETITITEFVPGRYELFVHNFAEQNWEEPELVDLYEDNPASFATSGAELVVYDGEGQELHRFVVPSTGSGFFWNVLSIDGGEDPPTITPQQILTNARKNAFSEYAGICNPN